MAKLDWDRTRRQQKVDFNHKPIKPHFRYDAIADNVMPYGAHKGVSITAIPFDYLTWGAANMGNEHLKARLQYELARRTLKLPVKDLKQMMMALKNNKMNTK